MRDIFTLLCVGNKIQVLYQLLGNIWVGRNDDSDDEEEKEVDTCRKWRTSSENLLHLYHFLPTEVTIRTEVLVVAARSSSLKH